MSQLKLFLFLALSMLLFVLSACQEAKTPTVTTESVAEESTSSTIEEEDRLQVAFIYVAEISDVGWTYSHDQGRIMLENAISDVILETTFVTLVPEGPESEPIFRQFAEQGYDLVIGTSFGYGEAIHKVAADYPQTQFVHISGMETAPNVSTLFGRIYQPRYLSGLVAGATTETNIIGYVAAFPIPEVIRGINAFTIGVREVNPEAKIHVVWTNSWFDPQKERAAAESLLALNVDVIAQHQDTLEPQQVAANNGIYSISYNSYMAPFVGGKRLDWPYVGVGNKIH